MIKNNGMQPHLLDSFPDLAVDIQEIINQAHKGIHYTLLHKPPPYPLHRAKCDGGVIYDDPAPNGQYASSLAGSWIWSHPKAFFRFRAIMSKGSLQIWDFGDQDWPVGVPRLKKIKDEEAVDLKTLFRR